LKQTLLITRDMPGQVLQAAQERFEVTVFPGSRALSVTEAQQALADYDLILPTLGDGFGTEAFAQGAARCRLLANFGVGYNHIDVAAAQAAGVAVSNTPGAVTDATADIGLLLMLMTARRAGQGERMLRAGRWDGWSPTQLLGLHMTGKTVGIIGMGRIGKAIARRAHYGFDMRVVFFNRSKVADPGMVAEQLDSLVAVMRAVDVVVVAVPGGAGTRHLIDGAALDAMQPHAILINVARGDVVDEAALIAALKAGQIGGAGLDVYENEPHVPEALRQMENVTLLPHLGTAALEVREAMGMMAVDNLFAFVDGHTPPNVIR
jgi:gluconate 2-dehydrogenase